MQLTDRVVRLLNVLADSPSGLQLTEIAARLELSPSTAHRLLGALAPHKFVYQGADRRYRIGPGIVRLAQAFQRQNPVLAVSRPVLDRVSQELQESVFLSELIGNDVVCVATAEASRLLTFYMRISERTPYHAGASARAILAFSPPEQIAERLAAEPLTAFTERTPTTIDDAIHALEGVRERGYATCDEEMEIGVVALAAPIFDAFGCPTAALTVVAPADRLAPAVRTRPVEVLRQASAEISRGLGFDGAETQATPGLTELSNADKKG